MPIGIHSLPSRVLIGILSCLGPALWSGCGFSTVTSETGPPKHVQAGPPNQGGTLTLALATPTSLDPALTDDVYEATVVNQIFSGLVQLDANLNVLPELAKTWKISKDKLVYEFHLRRDAYFHHGRQVTADDFVYSFTRLFDEEEIPPGIIQDYLGKVQGVPDYRTGRHLALGPSPVPLRRVRPDRSRRAASRTGHVAR